jgi:hypothetical protein
MTAQAVRIVARKMSVVNVKVAYIRPLGYKDLKAWAADDRNAYIGRAGVVFVDGVRFPPAASPFANPFKIGKDGTRDAVLAKYRDYITTKLEASPALVSELLKLKDKHLGCWCAPDPCHGHILLELIDRYS